jgi:hypothetical protein
LYTPATSSAPGCTATAIASAVQNSKKNAPKFENRRTKKNPLKIEKDSDALYHILPGFSRLPGLIFKSL